MKNNMFRKGLVLGIIVIFISVGFQPVFAVNVSNTSISDDEDNCDIYTINI